MKPMEKIKLISKATALLAELETVNVIKRIPLLTELTSIVERLGLSEPAKGKIDDSGAYDANTDPTPAQAEAGNYKKGKVKVAGFDIRIESPKGSTRSGTDENGDGWSTTMKNHYGDLLGTKGADGDPLDVFLGELDNPEQVFIVDQIEPQTRQFDEHKIMLGFSSVQEAKKSYFANYDDNWQGFGAVKAFTLDKFKQWVAGGKTRTPVKYKNGAFQERKKEVPAQNLEPKDYQHLDAVALKAAMFKASNDGHSLDSIAPVFDYWLTVNQAA